MLIHALAILIMLRRHLLSFMMAFRCFYETWSSPEVDELSYLLMVLLNSFLEKGSHSMVGFNRISSNRLGLIQQFWAKLNVWYNICHRSLILMQECLLYCNTSIVGILHFLIQFMRFQGFWFFDAISWILSLKNKCLVFLMTFLKIFQSSIILEDLYMVSLS